MSEFNLNEMNENMPHRTAGIQQISPVSTGPVDLSNATTLDTSVFVSDKPENTMENSLFADLDAAVNRECAKISALHDSILDKQMEEHNTAEAEAEERLQEEEDNFALNGKHASMTTIDEFEDDEEDNKKEVSVKMFDNVDIDDLFDDEDEEEASNNEKSEKDEFEDIKLQIREKIKPIRKTLDLSRFTIKQKAMNAQKVMKLVVDTHQNVADWVLPFSNRSISMSGLSGPEIIKLNPENTSRNKLNTFRDMYNIIYNHVIDGNKPEYETWLKQTKFADLQHIYFCIYKATFGDSNFASYSCPKCNKVFINDINIDDMVVYENDDVKNAINRMLSKDSTSESNDSFEATLIPISDVYAVSIRTPSIWNVIMETATLSDDFLEKYADQVDAIAYIEGAYIIDAENEELTPVDMKPDANNQAKTSARRIKILYDIISTLNSEEYYYLRSEINNLDKKGLDVKYKIPGCKCKYCGADIPDNSDISPDQILFIRHQLAALGNM